MVPAYRSIIPSGPGGGGWEKKKKIVIVDRKSSLNYLEALSVRQGRRGEAYWLVLLQSDTFGERRRAAIIFSYSLMQTVNGSLSIKDLFMSFITPHFLIALYRAIWVTVTALFHFALAMYYKWAGVRAQGRALK